MGRPPQGHYLSPSTTLGVGIAPVPSPYGWTLPLFHRPVGGHCPCSIALWGWALPLLLKWSQHRHLVPEKGRGHGAGWLPCTVSWIRPLSSPYELMA